MAGARCPHCQAPLPEAATFCAACGRRIAGWSTLPDGSRAPDGDPLPEGEAQTRQMEPTPSLLRAAAVAKQARAEKKAAQQKGPRAGGPVETDSALMRAVRHRRAPLVVALVLLGAGAAGAGFFLVRRSRMPADPTRMSATAPPPRELAVAPAISPTGASGKPVKPGRRKNGPHRVEAVDATPPPSPRSKKISRKPAKEPKGGALPHKTVATDSSSLAKLDEKKHDRAKTDAPAVPPPEDLPSESTPLTDAEEKAQAEASIDANGVRAVVKMHLPQVHTCYERAFKDSSPGGRVEIAFVIDPQGRAKSVRTDSNSTDSETLARCLESRIAEWQFPRPVGGDYELIYPFVFSPGS